MSAPGIPGATYRLQFNNQFTFADAGEIVAYLHRLGTTHVYASSFLKARAGSPHGYDIVDHNALNPEIGDTGSFDAYVETLHRYGMGQLLDIIPNHVGVGGDDNDWWLDVLENGEASPYAPYFDIDWYPVNPALHNKVLLPFLGDHYGALLERGELRLVLAPEQGAFAVRYYEHLFPLDPRTYPWILDAARDVLARQAGPDHRWTREVATLIAECRSIPRRTALSAPRRAQRRERGSACKRRLAELCRTDPEILACVERAVEQFNGTPGEPPSFDSMHLLLESQAYRLAYWLVASDEINYRRFFDINELAGIRMDNSAVFDATHSLILKLVAGGQVNGLHIDHPDGLSDPYDYYRKLQGLTTTAASAAGQSTACYILVEKILASHEHLPSDWPIAGTTGYEFAHLLNGLFVYPQSAHRLTRLYTRFTGRSTDFDQVLYECKKLIIHSSLAGELNVLANLAGAIAGSDRRTRDFTYQRLRQALGEVVACFPVYRTYITRQRISEQDRRYVQWAIEQAKKRSPAANLEVFDFIHGLLTLRRPGGRSQRITPRMNQFCLRFQQYTAPVMAKGMEDTALYVFNRLVSLNDVGFDPRTFGISINAFHHGNRQRLGDWPHAMVSTSTHDSKRSEDVRARINVLSELPREWQQHLARWSRVNRGKKRLVGELRVPSRNDEYLLYQTLLGTWPLEPLDDTGLAAYMERIQAYMLKAIREAKVHTSWINTNTVYEEAMQFFVRALLDDPVRNPFLADFLPFQQRIARFGLLNSLSQVLLKLTVPGVPDLYQGNELWTFQLVDPDNRRPVDYARRQALLQALEQRCRDTGDLPELLRELLKEITDGRAKLYLTWKTLDLRRAHPRLFAEGDYLGLETAGPAADHICAFTRRCDDDEVLVAAPRWFARLGAESGEPADDSTIWRNTRVRFPESARPPDYRNVLTGEPVRVQRHEAAAWLDAADLFRSFPVALLSANAAARV